MFCLIVHAFNTQLRLKLWKAMVMQGDELGGGGIHIILAHIHLAMRALSA